MNFEHKNKHKQIEKRDMKPEYDETMDDGNYECEQTMKLAIGASIGIMFIVALLLQFNKISLTLALIILATLTVVCLMIKFSFRKSADSLDEESDDVKKQKKGSNQGWVLLAFLVGLIIFMTITSSTSIWIISRYFNGYSNFWIKLFLNLGNIALWVMWTVYSFDQKHDGAVLLQLKLNGKYREWGKNMRPAWWGVCKVTPFIGWLEGKLESFSEETKQITHSVFKVDANKEDGAVVMVKVNNDDKTSFPIVVKFEATTCIDDTYIVATTRDKEKGAEKQLVPKIFGGLMTLMNTAEDDEGVRVTKLEDFEPIRPGLKGKATKLMSKDFKGLGHYLKVFTLTAIEPTINEEEARTNARAMIAAAKGESDAETVKLDAGIRNVKKTKKELEVDSELAIPFVLATQGDSRRLDTNVTAQSGSPKPGKKGSKASNTESNLSQAALFAALDNDGHKHGGGNSGD